MSLPLGLNQTPDSIREDTALGRPRLNGIYVGIVKGNSDPQRMGRLSVYIPELGGDPEDQNTWYVMSYASPFAGATNLDNNDKDGEAKKKMAGTQISYGWWAVPPDINNEVVCCFINGDTARGVWFACLYQQFMNHMVPAMGINVSTDDEINQKNLPPVCEYNRKDSEQNIWDPKRPVFEPLHNSLVSQGLYVDPERGPATTGARRESPSKVFGFSTPRGNNIHVDDDEENEFIRLRTRSGVQLLIHETTGYIYMISKLGNSWFELSDEGINMYSKKSISMRSEENINIHADRGVYRHATVGSHSRDGNHTAAHESDSNTEVSKDRSSTTGGTATSNADKVNRNANNIADASGPKQPESVTPGDTSGQPKAVKNPDGSGGKPSTPGSTASNKNTAAPGSRAAREGSVSYRNNNPGNLQYGPFAKSYGATGADTDGNRTAKFPDYASGRAAAEALVFQGKYANSSFQNMMYQYAPPGSNNTAAYISQIQQKTGIDIHRPMNQFSTQERGVILDAMQKHEGWYGPKT